MNDIERIHVYDTYNLIADHKAPGIMWPNVKRYIDLIELGVDELGYGKICIELLWYEVKTFVKFVQICK